MNKDKAIKMLMVIMVIMVVSLLILSVYAIAEDFDWLQAITMFIIAGLYSEWWIRFKKKRGWKDIYNIVGMLVFLFFITVIGMTITSVSYLIKFI